MKSKAFAEIRILLSLTLMSAAVLLAQGTGAAGDKEKPKEVICEGFKFKVGGKEKEPLTIRVGESVVWLNKDDDDHTATSDKDSEVKFDEVAIPANGKSKLVKFTKAGTYKYHCKPHPKMKGTIIVKE